MLYAITLQRNFSRAKKRQREKQKVNNAEVCQLKRRRKKIQ